MNNQHTIKQEVGVWIDHKEAFVLFNHEQTDAAKSSAAAKEKHVRYSEHATEGESPSEDQRERRHENRLNQYYDDVIPHLKDATSILIFGPGEAKGEFKKRLESKGLGDRIVGCETVDNLTNNQMVAKVKSYFNK
ncbi:MAG: hypothetical protein V4732_12160 [Pseudomonadota bacterium]